MSSGGAVYVRTTVNPPSAIAAKSSLAGPRSGKRSPSSRGRKVLRAVSAQGTRLCGTDGGEAAATNAGVAASSGDMVILLDADDVLLPSAAGRASAALDVPGAVKVHWPVETVDASGRSLGGRLPLDPLPAGDLRAHLLDVRP